MTHLIVGLGNVGDEYAGTRHNIGFRILDALTAGADSVVYADKRYGLVAEMRVKNQQLILLKPTTLMNLSGNAVRYWMNERHIPLERLLVLVDDLALPLGTIRIKPSGSEGGHNGLRHITQTLGTQQYARLRMGIGNDFPRGTQIDYVLSRFTPEEETLLAPRLTLAADAVRCTVLEGLTRAMNAYNGK